MKPSVAKNLYRVSLLVVMLFAVWMAWPHALKWTVHYALREGGHERATVDEVRFNPFTGKVGISSADLGKHTQEQIDMGLGGLDFEYAKLLEGKLVAKDIHLSDLVLEVKLTEAGEIIIGGFILTGAETEEAEEDEDPWGVGFSNIDLENIVVSYSDPIISAELFIRKLHIDPAVSWEPDKPTNFTAELTLNDAPLTFAGVMRPFNPAPSVGTRIMVDGLALAPLEVFLTELSIKDFSSSLSVNGFVDATFEPHAQGRARFEGEILLGSNTLTAGAVTINGSSIGWSGEITGVADDQGYYGSIKGTNTIGGFVLAVKGERVSAEKFTGTGVAEFAMKPARKTLKASGEGLLTHRDVVYEGMAGKTTVSLIDVGGSSTFAMALESGEIGLTGDGNVEVRDASHTGENIYASLSSADFSANVEVDMAANGLPKIVSVVELELSEAILDIGSAKGGISTATWAGPVDFNLSLEGFDLSTEGVFSMAKGTAESKSPSLSASLDRMRWEGDADLSFDYEKGPFPVISGDVALNGVSGYGGGGDRMLVSVGETLLTKVKLDSLEEIFLDSLGIKDLKVFDRGADREDRYVATVGLVEANKLRLKTAGEVSLDSVVVKDLVGDVARGEKGGFEWDWLAAELGGDDTPKEPVGEAATESMSKPDAVIRVGSFELKGDSSFAFRDAGFNPPLAVKANPIELTIKNVDTSAQDQIMSLGFATALDEFSSVKVEGEGTPMAEATAGTATATIRGIDLGVLTPITERFASYRLVTGQLDLDTSISNDGTVTDLKNEILLRRFTLKELAEEDRDPLAQSLGLPVNFVLSLLRDSEGNIELSIPVTFDSDEMDVGISDVVTKLILGAIGKAMKSAVLIIFAPLGIAADAISLSDALDFDPIVFEPSSAELGGSAIEFLTKVETILFERPKVSFSLCGIAALPDASAYMEAEWEQALTYFAENGYSPAYEELIKGSKDSINDLVLGPPDLPQLDKAKLLELARERSHRVKGLLVDKGIAQERLLICSPEFRDEPESLPSVKVSL